MNLSVRQEAYLKTIAAVLMFGWISKTFLEHGWILWRHLNFAARLRGSNLVLESVVTAVTSFGAVVFGAVAISNVWHLWSTRENRNQS